MKDARVISFPTDTRTLRRRRLRGLLSALVPVFIAVVVLIAFIALLILLGVHENPCEPNQGC